MDSDIDIKKICPNCSQLYHLKSANLKSAPNIPLFLKCGHSMCEKCIKNIVKFEEPIECKVCHEDTIITAADRAMLAEQKEYVYKLFPVNKYMVGELIVQQIFESKSTNKGKVDNESYIDIKNLMNNTEVTQGECLECHGPTSKMCQQCDIILCNNCFNKTHKNFIIFKNHMLQSIEMPQQKNTCNIHRDKPLDYYCKDCLKSICMDCLMVGGEKSCKNHDVTSIQEVNETFLSEIADLTPKVDEILRRFTKTAIEIGNLLTKIDEENTSSDYMVQINNIEQYFSIVNSIMQQQKEEITLKLLRLTMDEKESLREAKNDISESIKKAKKTLNTVHSLDSNKLKEMNLSALLEEVKEIINTPWYLHRDECETPITVKVNEDLYPLLCDYVSLDGEGNSKYKLCTTNELTERNVEIPVAPTSIVYPPDMIKDVRQINKQKPKEEIAKPQAFIKTVPKYRSHKSESLTSLNSINSDASHKSYLCYEQHRPQVESVTPFPDSQHPKQLHEGCQELIYISHIVDPHNLFVQRACQQDKVQELLREFRNAVSLPKPSISHVAEGKVYLVFNKVDNLWQRCRVVSIDRKDDKPIFKVFCVDFGSTEEVHIDKLRLLPPARIQSPPPFAINCSLANCVPINGAWTSDDSFLVQNIIDNKRAVIHVRRIRSTDHGAVSFECDITTFEDGVSLAHALAYQGRARIPAKLSYPKMMGAADKPKLFINNSDFKRNVVEEVYITHIVNPDYFFVRKRHLQNVFAKLCEDLDQEYSLNVNTGRIYLPEKDMVCVANVEKCGLGAKVPGSWARGVVVEMPSRGRVRLLLPDVGAHVILHWTALRRILPKFTTLRGLATECHLAGVTPLNKKWNAGSVTLLEKFTDQVLELHVEESRNRGSVGVTLYDKSDEDNVICINIQMIKYKYAVSFGLYMFNKNTEMEDLVFTNKSPLDEPKPKSKPKNAITVLKKSQPLPMKSKGEDLEAKDKGPLRLEAKILNYQSPSLIYVSVVHQQKVFNELFEKIQNHYSKKKTQGKDDWKVEDRCCTICTQSQTWRRAAILEIDGDNAKVFYSDFACIETVPLSGLRKLPPEFESIGDAAIRCHLNGVIPAVGEEWPSLTKEFLQELLDAYKRIFITRVGQFKNESMPVQIWVYHTIQGGALEPNISEWRCLNTKIIEQGLGIPDRSDEVASAEVAASTSTDDTLSFLNITGSVRDWLQIEPMPLKPLKIKPDSESNSSSSTPVDTEAMKENDPENPDTVFISDWLPPEPLSYDEFTAMPTYIDNDGVIYLHDISQQDTLDLIRKALDVRFKNPDPKAKYVKWTVGEPCIAMFFLDNRFYRGRILEVNEETSHCLIHYIDYGNEEMCAFENIRKSIALYQIPTQAHKCVLNRIRPVGKNWDQQTLDYIHKSIVEKQCYVKVSGQPIGDLVPVELKYDKLWINDHLVDFELAVYSDGTKAVVRKFAQPPKKSQKIAGPVESDSGPDYIIDYDDYLDRSSESQDSVQMKSLHLDGKDWNEIMKEDELGPIQGHFVSFPAFTETEFLCNIAELNELKKFELSVVQDQETSKMYEKMYAQLQTGHHEAALNGIFENKACLALFPDDGKWYRTTILQYSEAKALVKVKYIDYGNIEVVPLTDVREISDEYLHLPPATITATLHGVSLNPIHEEKTVAEKFASIFLDMGPFHVKVINPDLIPSVELRDDDGNLVYDNLIQEKILLKDD